MMFSAFFCFFLLGNGLGSEGQTFVNQEVLGKGIIFEIMMHNLSAIKYIDNEKIYLKTERIVPSDQGLMLLADDSSMILLPKIYSDQHGCFVKSCMICTTCGSKYSADVTHFCCPHCIGD